jgi:putative acetyltransferase
VILRPETPADRAAIHALTAAAFEGHPHSDGSEPRIIEALRDAGALSLSVVAEIDGVLVGQASFSPVQWDGDGDWFGLGPVSVAPNHQNQGLGRTLTEAGLEQLRRNGARGCVVMGEPAYYSRFGFARDERFTYPGVPAEYFMALACGAVEGAGKVRYHPAFG